MSKKKFNFHNQIKDFRLDNNLSQSDMAFLLEIRNIGRISEWENNKTYPDFIHSLALEHILHRFNSQTYQRLSAEIKKNVEERMKLLEEKKKRERRLDKDG